MWNKAENELPKKDGQYLCLVKMFNYIGYRILSFAKDLSKVDKYDFENKHKSGFYDYDSEMGYYEYGDVIFWMELPELPKGE